MCLSVICGTVFCFVIFLNFSYRRVDSNGYPVSFFLQNTKYFLDRLTEPCRQEFYTWMCFFYFEEFCRKDCCSLNHYGTFLHGTDFMRSFCGIFSGFLWCLVSSFLQWLNCSATGGSDTGKYMASGINIYLQLLISLIRIVDISNSNC